MKNFSKISADFLSVVRALSAPGVFYCIYSQYYSVALIGFLLAASTDFFDGLCARRWGKSSWGSYLDPLADKILLGCVGAALAYQNILPLWFVLVLIGRDLLILLALGILHLLKISWTPQPSWISKINTALQMGCFMGGIFLQIWTTSSITEKIYLLFLYLTGLTTVLSGLDYGLLFIQYCKKDPVRPFNPHIS
jgi:cardiolipin synthase (CMP-forming)